MSTLDQISADLKLAESRQRNLNKTFHDLQSHSSAIASLTLQWQELETHFNTIQTSLNHHFKQLQSKEQYFNSVQTLVEQRLRELESKESDYSERLKKLESDENRFKNALQSKVKPEPVEDFESSCVDNVNIQFSVSMDGKGLQLFLNEKGDHGKIGEEVYAAIRMSADPAKLVLDAIEGFYAPHLKKGDREFDVGVVRRSCVVLLEQLLRLSPQIMVNVREEAAKVANEWKGKMRVEEGGGDWLEGLGFLLLVGSYGLVSDFDGDEILKFFGIVEKHRQVPELRRALAIADKVAVSSILHFPVKIEQSTPENVPSNSAVASLSVSPWPEIKSFCISMDGNGLRWFLSEHVNEHNAIQSEVFDALQCASDPVKLVLDAMQGFIILDSPGVKRFKLGVNRKSCIFLLEQLRRISPQIEPQMKEEAMKIAVDWYANLIEKKGNTVKVLVFLQFLATFGLASSFKANELLPLLKIVYTHQLAPGLSQILGLANKIPKLIHFLIKKNQRVDAIRYIYAFNLVDEFPPVPLLKAHVDYSKALSKKICQEGNYSRLAWNEATKKEINALRPVIRCIADHKLESVYSPEIIENHIAQLGKQEEDREGTATAPAPDAQSQKQSRIKRPRTAVSMEATPDASVDTTTAVYPIQPTWQPPQQPVGLVTYQGAPSSNTSARYYGSKGSTPGTLHLNSIANHKLESKYSPGIIERHIAQLGKQEEDREGTAPACAPARSPEAQLQNQSGTKHLLTSVSMEATPNASVGTASTIYPIQPPWLPPRHPAGLVAYQGAPSSSTSARYYSFKSSTPGTLNLNSSAGVYPVAGSTIPTAHTSSSARQYGSGIAVSGNTGQFNLAGTYFGGTQASISGPNIHYYHWDALNERRDFNRPTSFNGYSSPLYRSSLYP